MARIRILLGAVASDSIRGVVLSDLAGQPAVTLDPSGAPVTVRPAGLSAAAERALGGVRVFHFEAANLAKGAEYRLAAASAGARDETGFRTLDPDAASLKVVVASCYYDGFHRAFDYLATLRSARLKDASFKLLIGDNVYADVHDRQRDDSLSDGYLETGYIYRKYFWESDGYSRVLGTLPTFTTWDDHEFWNNFPEKQFWLSRTKDSNRPRYIAAGQEYLRSLQAALNPSGPLSYKIPDTPVVSFFVADVRSERDPMGAGARMMPRATLDAIASWANALDRPGVLVLGQPLVIEEGGSGDYTPPDFREEFAELWRVVIEAPWEILVVSGDVHHSRALLLLAEGDARVFEVVTSPACHIPTVWTTVTGSYSSQDQGDVEFPRDLKAGGHKPRVERYYFGTEAENTIGALAFRIYESHGASAPPVPLARGGRRLPGHLRHQAPLPMPLRFRKPARLPEYSILTPGGRRRGLDGPVLSGTRCPAGMIKTDLDARRCLVS